MNTNNMARRIIGRIQKTDVSLMTDAELLAIVNEPLTDLERAEIRRYSGGRTDDLTELTDSELQHIVDGLPAPE